jgi:hypothetical protein
MIRPMPADPENCDATGAEAFIARWCHTGGSERELFIGELCAPLGRSTGRPRAPHPGRRCHGAVDGPYPRSPARRVKVSLSEEALADATQAADWYIDQAIWPGALERLSLSATSAGTMPANMAADTVVLRRTVAWVATLILA